VSARKLAAGGGLGAMRTSCLRRAGARRHHRPHHLPRRGDVVDLQLRACGSSTRGSPRRAPARTSRATRTRRAGPYGTSCRRDLRAAAALGDTIDDIAESRRSCSRGRRRGAAAVDSVLILACAQLLRRSTPATGSSRSPACVHSRDRSEYRYRSSVPNPNALWWWCAVGRDRRHAGALKHARASTCTARSPSATSPPAPWCARRDAVHHPPGVEIAWPRPSFTTQLARCTCCQRHRQGAGSMSPEREHAAIRRCATCRCGAKVLALEPQIIASPRPSPKENELFLARLHYPIASRAR